MGQGIDLVGTATRIIPERPVPALDAATLRTVLLIKLSSIGDVVHALPVASALKRSSPDVHITWAVEEWTAPLVIGHPAIDRVVVLPSMAHRPRRVRAWAAHWQAALRELRMQRFDVVADLQGLARSAALSRWTRAGLRVARSGQREGAHLVSFGVPLGSERQHAVEEYLRVAGALGARPGPVEFALPVHDAASQSVAHMLRARNVPSERPVIVVNPSAAQRHKQWSADKWTRVIDALAERGSVVIIGASANARSHATMVGRARSAPVDLTGHTTVAEVVALLKRATLHVAPDTGTVHIAAALGTPVVAVYGPTRPWRVGPWQQAEGVVDHGDRCGRGCPAYCVFNRRCLSAATAAEVIAKVDARLAVVHA